MFACCVQSSWYHVHHVTREEFEKNIEEKRKFDVLELDGRQAVEFNEKLTFSKHANERSTGKRALQTAAASRIETDMEQSIAKV